MYRLTFLLLIIITACRPEPSVQPEEPTGNPTGYVAEIEVSVVVCDSVSGQFCISDYPASGALVELFASEYDREEENVLNSKVSNSSGRALFSGLDAATRYYLRTTYLQEEIESTESTPNNGIARHELLFFE